MTHSTDLSLGSVFVVQGYGRVIFRGLTPHGWPLVNLEQDPSSYGTLIIQGSRGEGLLQMVEDVRLGRRSPIQPRRRRT